MTSVTQYQLDLLRTIPQEVDLHLSIYKPSTILACRVNNISIAKGARSIAYDTVSSGSYTNVVGGMTMLVGSTPGASDLGKVRVKSATSGVITVAGNSNIRWADNIYLTIINFIDIVPVFPRAIANIAQPETENDFTFYKDYDIVYTNQNSILGSFVNMGPHRAASLDDNGQALLYWSASGTSHVNGDTLSYQWLFPGATGITGSTAMTPGYIDYRTPGNYVTALSVSGSGGSVDTSYRYVTIHPKGGEFQWWELTGLQGSRDSSGFVGSVSVRSEWADLIYDGAVVVIYSDDWYGNIPAVIGGNSENNGKIFFVGYILQDSITYNYQQSKIDFKIGSVSEVMKLTNGFAISVEDEVTAAKWYQLVGLNVKKAIYHFLRWHSTVLQTTDFQFLATDQLIQFYDSNRESIFDAVNGVIKSALMGEIVTDRQGKLWAENRVEATNLAKTAYPAKFTVNNSDWINEPSIQETNYDVISYMEMGGVKYVGTAAKLSAAFLAVAPGETPGLFGKIDTPTGLAVTSQSMLNNLVGDVYTYRNAKTPTIDLNLHGAYRNLDIAPQEGLNISILASDTARNRAISDRYFTDAINYTYDGENKVLLARTSLRQITEGVAGDTLIIPPDAPINGYDSPTFNFPSFPTAFSFPPFPGFEHPPLPPAPSLANKVILLMADADGVWYTENFDDEIPVWVQQSLYPLPTGTVMTINNFELCKTTNRIYFCNSTNVWSTLVGTPNSPLEIGTAANLGQADPLYYYVVGIGCDEVVDNTCGVMVGGYPSSATRYSALYKSNPSSGILERTQYGLENGQGQVNPSQIGRMVHYLNSWYATMNYLVGVARFRKYPDALTSWTSEQDLGTADAWLVHARTADFIYTIDQTTSKKITSEGTVFTATNIDTSQQAPSHFDCDPTGQYIMYYYAISNTLKISSDFGVTKVDVTSNLPGGVIPDDTTTVLNLGDGNKWLFTFNDGSVLQVLYTHDGGVTWTSKIGNLATALAATAKAKVSHYS